MVLLHGTHGKLQGRAMESISSLLRLSQTWIGTFLFTVVKFWYLRHGGLAFMRKTSWMNPYWCISRDQFYLYCKNCTGHCCLNFPRAGFCRPFISSFCVDYCLTFSWPGCLWTIHLFIHSFKTLLSLSNDGQYNL